MSVDSAAPPARVLITDDDPVPSHLATPDERRSRQVELIIAENRRILEDVEPRLAHSRFTQAQCLSSTEQRLEAFRQFVDQGFGWIPGA